MRCKNIFIFVFVIFLIGLASAYYTFNINGTEIMTQYEADDSLRGNLNISFFNEPLNSTFSDSLGNSINLSDLLDLNDDYYYLFNDLTNTTVSSAFQELELDEAGFHINGPIGGNLTYRLNFTGNTLFEKNFQILSSKSLIQQTIDYKYAQLNASKAEIAKYDFFVQDVINNFINATSIEEKLNNLQTRYENAETNEEYTTISDNLSSIKIPRSISETIDTSPITFYPKEENIDLDVLKDIGGGDYGDKEKEYIGTIYSWNDKNLKTTLTFREVIVGYSSNEQITLKIFQFIFDKSEMSDDAYFIVEKFQDIRFENLLSSQIGESSYGYLYVNLKDISNSIVFSTTQDIDFLAVPVFISPAIVDLTLPKAGTWEVWVDNSKTKWILFAVIVFLVLLIGIVLYVLIQRWYRRKYEVHLFKTRNNLFNIMTYIQNAKKKNMPREEILSNLKKAGWTGEQIKYAMTKYENKKIAGLIQMPMNITPETEKKPVINTKPVYKTINMNPNPAIEKKPDQNNQNKNTKV